MRLGMQDEVARSPGEGSAPSPGVRLYCDKINIYESLIPSWGRDIDLGHTSQPFDNLYLNNLVLNGTSIVGVDNNTITHDRNAPRTKPALTGPPG